MLAVLLVNECGFAQTNKKKRDLFMKFQLLFSSYLDTNQSSKPVVLHVSGVLLHTNTANFHNLIWYFKYNY